MNNLKNISSEIIRQNWLNYKDEIFNSPYYQLLWDDFENKFGIDKDNIYLTILKKFINNEKINYKKPLFNKIHINQMNEETLIFKGLNGEERKNIHHLCNKIGLHHESKPHPKNKYKKFLYIYKPKLWLWEYTGKNPYSESEEYYEKRETERQIKEEKLNEKLSKKYCCICEKNGLETELLRCVFIRGLYCNDCIDTMSDEDGGKLCDHKFESLYIKY